MSERPTFSPFWHRVRTLKPRLRPHVQITRQRYRARRWHVVHDPASNQFYRLNPIAHEFVGLLDGRREVEEAWKIALGKFGDSAPTQNEVIQLISQLYSANLLAADVPPETEQLLRRGRERLKKKIQQQAIGIMYLKVRLFNPDRILTALEPIFRPILNRWGLLAWAALVVFGLTRVLPHWTRLVDGFDQAIAPANWGWLIAVYIAIKAIHETGHGLICKRFGGQVPEFGAMMLVMFPSPYVDASACWAFPSKWQRAAVGAGGMIFELFVASLAAILWSSAVATGRSGELATQLAYNAMLTASLSTVLFNANPLMRFDGYYILADLLETPNLAQRSNQMLKHLIQKYIYRIERPSAMLPSQQRGEQAILVAYGLAALAYRVFLFVSITLFVMGKMFALGLVLALWTAAAWFIVPVAGFAHWLAANNQLAEHRARHVLVSAGLAAVTVVALGVVRMPDRRRAYGVLESRARSGIFAGADGFVVEVHARPGDRLRAGEPILTMDSAELRQERLRLVSKIAEAKVQERQAMKAERPAVAQVALAQVGVLQNSLEEADRRIGELVVRAPHDGVVVRTDPARLLGAYLKRGEAVCDLVDPASIRIAATVGQADADWLFDTSSADRSVEIVRVARAQESPIVGGAVEPAPAGREELPSAAMGFSGGGQIETEPQDRTGQVAKRPTFTVYVTPQIPVGQAGEWVGSPGERVKLRFTLPPRPLLFQWTDRLAKTLQGRVNV